MWNEYNGWNAGGWDAKWEVANERAKYCPEEGRCYRIDMLND
jgi:hypothetical protein